MAAEGHNVDGNLMAIGRDHGHYFVKKTFGKPVYCHHCCDKIWGMLSQGYACETCNFVCHDKCLKTVVSYCSGVALQLIKNPVAHTWSEPAHIKRRFCCVCRKKTDDVASVECEVCEYYVHVECQDLAVSDCREAATFVPSLDKVSHKQFHHMREGNLPRDSKCVVCKKNCHSAECFTGMRCGWCNVTMHAICYRQLRKECDFGSLRKIMLPPNSVTIPRTELPMEQLLNIHAFASTSTAAATVINSTAVNNNATSTSNNSNNIAMAAGPSNHSTGNLSATASTGHCDGSRKASSPSRDIPSPCSMADENVASIGGATCAINATTTASSAPPLSPCCVNASSTTLGDSLAAAVGASSSLQNSSNSGGNSVLPSPSAMTTSASAQQSSGVAFSLANVATSASDEKESEDHELLWIFDGNNSIRNHSYRTASVPKTATVDQIRDIAMRRFHITDNPENYYVTQAPHNPNDEEEPLEDPIPLRNMKKPEGRRAQIFLRYRDDPEKACVKVYGGWLRIPVTFTAITVTRKTVVQDLLAEALENFGLDGRCWNKYNLIEVSLERGVAERTANPQEHMLQLVRNLRKDSLRRYHVVRFYIQEKEDPHDHAVFVGNLPPSLAQRQYERILLKLLGAKEKPFTAIGPIYFEYGSLIITFNTPKAATAAVQRLQEACYEDKKLIVLCLPNIQSHMIPPDVEPLLVLVNVKSGGCQGTELITAFRRLLNPFQVFDVLKGGPLVGLYVFRNVPKYRILAAGGDGTIGWVLQCLDIAKQESRCFSPPCGIVPLGTGNDLARVLRWGGGYTGEENPVDILKDIIDAEEVRLDRWAVVFHEEERSQPPTSSGALEQTTDTDHMMNNPEDLTSMIIMNNYFGIGIDADVCLRFHNKRDANPEKFSSRLFNKTQYVKIGLQKAFFERNCRDLWRRIELEVDGKPIDLPACEGIIILNLMSWGSGANPWGTAKEEPGFQKPTHYDGLLEVVGITDVSRLGLIQSKLAAGIRIAQGGSIKITTRDEWPVQVDGEPHIQPPGTITILKSALKAKMLKKMKKSRRNAAAAAAAAALVSGGGGGADDEDGNGASPHLGVEYRMSHGKSTPDDLHNAGVGAGGGSGSAAAGEDEETDAFL